MENTLKIRCSSLGAIMTNPPGKKDKKDKKTGEIIKFMPKSVKDLSATCKLEIRKIWIWNNFHKQKDITSKHMEKGLENEEKALTMITEHNGRLYFKNQKSMSNDYLKGTPDIIHETGVIDTKVSWDIFTFMEAEMTKAYEYQLRGYMALTGLKSAQLVYVLTDTPEKLILDEVRRASWKMGMIEVPQEMEDLIRFNMTYDNVPKEKRVKTFEITHDEGILQEIYARIELCREYYNTIKL